MNRNVNITIYGKCISGLYRNIALYFLKKIFWNSFSIYFYVHEFWNPFLAPVLGRESLCNLESTLSDNTCIIISPIVELWFLWRKFWNTFHIYSYVELLTPLWAQILAHGSWLYQIRIFTIWGCLQIDAFLFLKRRLDFFLHFPYIYFYVEIWTPLVAPVLVWGSWLKQLKIFTIHISFINISISGAVVLETEDF